MAIKKRHVLIVSSLVMVLFIIYQVMLYYSLSLDDAKQRIVLKLVHSPGEELSSYHRKTKEDAFINANGVIRGVYFKQMKYYRPDSNNMFKCLNSDQIIPFAHVNDDYCDCSDHTDEPSTNACTEGIFYCDTQFSVKSVLASVQKVPSSRVGDGICDCCDGSDEWSTQVTLLVPYLLDKSTTSLCVNSCFLSKN